MNKLFPLSSQAVCIGIGALFVVLTAAFVLVPYGMERHPWESAGSLAAAAPTARAS